MLIPDLYCQFLGMVLSMVNKIETEIIQVSKKGNIFLKERKGLPTFRNGNLHRRRRIFSYLWKRLWISVTLKQDRGWHEICQI